MTESSPPSPSGMTSEPLTEPRGGDEWTLFPLASPASPSPSPGNGRPTRTNATSGPKPSVCYARWDPSGRCWRTFQASLLTPTSEPLSESFPRRGMTVRGTLWVPPMSEHPTEGIDSGSFADAEMWPTTRTTGLDGGSNSRAAAKARGKWVTPSAMDAKPFRGGELFQTATGSIRHRMPDGRTSNRGLEAQVRWPTPTTRDHKDGSAKSCRNVPVNGLLGRAIHGGQETPPMGSLNPAWVEWLMGFPREWTASRDSATPRSLSAQQQRFNDWLRCFKAMLDPHPKESP